MSKVDLLLSLSGLIFLIILSIFFSASETGIMALNRYRLRHMVRKGDHAAKRVQDLLERPDRILGVILIGNTFSNILASAITTTIVIKYFGDVGVLFATILLTLVILIFAEIMPKTVASIYPEKTSLLTSYPLKILLKLLYPLVWLANFVVNGCLRLFGVFVKQREIDILSREELRTVVNEAVGKAAGGDYQRMLLSILDLGKVTVDDVMIPRNDIIGIDVKNDWQTILNQLTKSEHTRLPVYRNNIENILGILHLRSISNLLAKDQLNKNTLLQVAESVYFIPSGTSLNTQLVNFQQQKKRIGMVVDEYGEIQGLITLEDILEEIVGKYTTSIPLTEKLLHAQPDGGYIVDGGINIRDLNRLLNLDIPTDGPKTLNGIIVEYLEMIPKSPVCLRISGYPIEIVEIKHNFMRKIKIWPDLRRLIVL